MVDAIPRLVLKGMDKKYNDWMAKVRQFDHTVVALEEELLDECINPPDSHCHFDDKYSADAWHNCQLLFAKHMSEMEIVKQIMPELTVCLTGNPRTDFLRQELVSAYYPARDKISRIVSSNFILINMNTGYINSSLSADQLLEVGTLGALGSSVAVEEWSESHDERMDAYAEWEKYNLKSVCKLIELFGQCSSNQKIIIRPHPSESLEIYTRLSRKYQNVEIASNRESARPWILASDILIHTGCTTGAEAVAMNHPTISIQEKGSEHIRFRASNNVSYLTHMAEEAYQAVQDFYAGKLKLGNASKLKEFWPVQEGKFAAERIADEMHQFYLELGGSFGAFKLSFSDKFRQPLKVPADIHKKMHVGLPQIEHILGQISRQIPAVPNIELHEICTNVFYMCPS